MTPPCPELHGDYSTLFSFLPIGAYRCNPDGVMVRVNPALVRLNGYDTEAELLGSVNDVALEWYVDPNRRAEFRRLLERDGFVRGFVSEIRRHRTRERIWISEHAHCVHDADGTLLYYEGTVEDITVQVHAQDEMRRSEEQLRLMTSQVPGMVYVVHVAPDGQRQYRFVSSGVRDIYGVAPEDIMRDASLPAKFRHPEDLPLLEHDMQMIREGPVDLGGEFRILMPDGSIKWVYRRSCTVSEDATGSVRVGVLLDITARKQAEAELRASEAVWKLALESAGDGVWDWNLQSGEEFISQGIKAMYGYADNELANFAEELDNRTHPDDLQQMQADRQAHFERRAPVYRNEHRVRCKDGSWKWVLSRGMVIARDADGKPLRMIGTHTDITELKQAEAHQRALEMQLRESQKMEAIGTLAGGVAHDFNNLLAAILGNLALAQEDVGAHHPARESLGEIQRAAMRARQLVQQILTFSRRQTQELQHQLLTPLVEEALGLLRSLLPAGVRLNARLPSTPLPVMADATQVQQVLMNLCTNAWQAMDNQAGEVTVALRSVEIDAAHALRLEGLTSGHYACLSVADNGPGMDEDTVRRIFEPFFTTKPPGAGTGLGLAVVHGIVKAHRGAIDVSSKTGEGTRFDVYLPMAAHASLVPDVESPREAGAPAPSALKAPHLVYIDDYEAMTFLAGRLLRKQGFKVTTFDSGEAAVAWLTQHPGEPIDLVLSDQNMPGMSGVDVAREVRQLRPGLGVAIVSGHVSDKLLADAAEQGVLQVMGKQDSMDALADAIRSLLGQLAARTPS
ncbi:MAG: PAS domain-containing protein [Hydrogenophaga sp.]|nr:PAS domain-containing protein [Hydrogenophaga sp.]